MTAPTAPVARRRHLPAVICLVALLALTGTVWWRVIHQDDTRRAQAKAACATPTPDPNAKLTTLPLPSSVTLTVLNSTQRNGLGGKVLKALKNDGFQIPETAANDPSGKAITGVAEIRYGTAGTAAATLLTYYVSGATLVPSNTLTDATVVLSLGKAYKALNSPAAVNAALAKDGITLTQPSTDQSDNSGCDDA